MDDAIQHKAANVGFVSSFFIHAIIMTAIMAIAGNTLHSTGKLLTVVLDSSGFTVADGVGGGKKAAGNYPATGRGNTCAPSAARQAKQPEPKARQQSRKESTAPVVAPPVAPQNNETAKAVPVELPVSAATANDFIIARADNRKIETTTVAEGPVASAEGNGGGKNSASAVRGETGNGAGSKTGTDIPGAGTAADGGTGGPGGYGSGKGAAALDTARARYLKEQFHYIRELVLRNIHYPAIARRMGWRGSVTVAFVIGEAGYVENVRIVRGSGHKILDENTVSAIERIQPFPRPPGRAEIVIPIEYKLG